MISYKSKIATQKSLSQLRKLWSENGEKVVFTNGCFDILHRGHVDYLNKAAALGTKLIVAINSDKSVSTIKGNNRPIQDETSRAEIMASLGCVDAVTIFDEDTPYNLIGKLLPEYLVKGGDWKEEDIVGWDIVKANGGKVMSLQYVDNYSTTGIINKLKQ